VTDIKKIDVSKQYGAQSSDFQLQQIAEAVNMLMGGTDQDQRAVRMFEFQEQIDSLSARLKKAGF
jgi:hypothetical protein